MTDIDSDTLLAEIQKKQRKFVYWPMILVLAILISAGVIFQNIAIWMLIPIEFLCFLSVVATYYIDQSRKYVVLMYDLDGDGDQAYQKLLTAVQTLSRCGAVWHITARGDIYDSKYHAGASGLLDRGRLQIRFRNPPFIKLNVTVACLELSQLSAYLLPDRVLVYGPGGIASIPYGTIDMSVRVTQFIEEETVPRDASIVGHTWRFVNKDGGPDLRFRNNRRIPVCEYEELEFTSTTGFHEIMQLSQLGASSEFRAAVLSMATVIRQARGSDHASFPSRTVRETVVSNPTRIPASPRATRASFPEPTNDDPRFVFFEVLCCMAFADNALSESEATMISTIMRKLHSGWSDRDCAQRLKQFFEDVDRDSYDVVLERSMSNLESFRGTAYKNIIMKSVQHIATVDKRLSKREREVYRRVREILS